MRPEGEGVAAERPPSIALCHEWLTSFGGAEQVSQRIAKALGIQDLYVFAAEANLSRRLFPDQDIHVHGYGRTWLGRRHWRWLLPVMPHAWRSLDLSMYRMVITSSYACTNAIRTPADSYHISYCHSPMRYAWDWALEKGRLPAALRPFWALAARHFRRADRDWSQRVTLFIASSENIANRIRRYYDRSSVVVYPPIDTGFWTPIDGVEREDFYLFAGRLVAFKRADVAVDAATKAGLRLVVVGSGPELARLKARAGPTVEFVAQRSQSELRDLYRRARAMVFPGVDDFGMAMVEAQACGTPVIAFDHGGAREIVEHGTTGLLYRDTSADALGRTLSEFDPTRFSVSEMRRRASRFEAARFDANLRTIVEGISGTSVSEASTDEFAEHLQRELVYGDT